MKTKTSKQDNVKQSKLFIDKATQIKADDDKARFEKACKSVIKKTKKQPD